MEQRLGMHTGLATHALRKTRPWAASASRGGVRRLVCLIDKRYGVQVTSHDSLSSHETVLLRSMNVRNPYVDPLNIIQVCVSAR